MTTFETNRLIMRPFEVSDFEPFAALNRDPMVMEHFLAPLTDDESQTFMNAINREHDARGYGLWALERKDTGAFIGFTGLHHHDGPTPPFPCVEVGWRLAVDAWGNGFATEAGLRALDHGFDAAGLEEIVSFTIPANTRSRAVMDRIGLTHDPTRDFDHPRVPIGHPQRRHVLYRITRDEWDTAR